METQLPEPQKQPTINAEALEQREIIIPKEIAHAFGRGLRQLLENPIGATKKNLILLGSFLKADNKEDVESIGESLREFVDIVKKIETSKEVKIVPFSSGYDLKFSEEIEEISPKKGTLFINEDLTPKFSSALFHNLGRNLEEITITSHILGKSLKDPDVQQRVEKLYSFSSEIMRFLQPIRNAYQLKITTGEKKTIIKPIPNLQNPQI